MAESVPSQSLDPCIQQRPRQAENAQETFAELNCFLTKIDNAEQLSRGKNAGKDTRAQGQGGVQKVESPGTPSLRRVFQSISLLEGCPRGRQAADSLL